MIEEFKGNQFVGEHLPPECFNSIKPNEDDIYYSWNMIPDLFSFNLNSDIYLAICLDDSGYDDGYYLDYLITKITQETKDKMLNDEIPLRDAVLSGDLTFVRCNDKFEKINGFNIIKEFVPENFLPDPGVTLHY